jgi:hypothetical protein
VDVDVGVGGSADDLLLGFLGARRVPANKVNGAAPFGDFQRCLKLCVPFVNCQKTASNIFLFFQYEVR